MLYDVVYFLAMECRINVTLSVEICVFRMV